MDKKIKGTLLVLLGLLRPVAHLMAQQAAVVNPTGGSLGIVGTVRGSDGMLISGARVSLSQTQPYPAARHQRTEWTTTTTATGAFQFPAVASGPYVLCAEAANWLNPCEWGNTPVKVVVGAYEKPGAVMIVLRPAATLYIRVEDSGQLLDQHEGKTSGAHLLIGVTSDAFVFHPAVVASSDTAGRNYQVRIPYDAGVKLVLSSSFFSVADGAGAALPQQGSTSVPVTVGTGQPPAAVKFHVTGAGH